MVQFISWSWTLQLGPVGALSSSCQLSLCRGPKISPAATSCLCCPWASTVPRRVAVCAPDNYDLWASLQSACAGRTAQWGHPCRAPANAEA